MNLKNRILKDEISKKIGEIKKVFFYRVCGTGMGAAAMLLKQDGFEVYGGDHEYFSPMSDYLIESGINSLKLSEISDDFLLEMDLIIVGNVVPKDSEDAKELKIVEWLLQVFQKH